MSSNDFFPALTSLSTSTSKSDQELVLVKGEENTLYVSCAIGGLSRRTLPIVNEETGYIAIHFTLFHQFGGRDTTVVRSYFVDYPPNYKEDCDLIELEIPVDDDFTEIDFVSNFYYLQIAFTDKHPGEMGISESVYDGKVLHTKIPFVLKDKKGYDH